MTDVLDREVEDLAPEFPENPAVALNRDGSVRKKPGPKPGMRRKAPRTAPAPGVRVPTAPRKPSSVDYRPAILGAAQIPQLVLGLAARFVKNEATKTAIMLDSMTIGIHAPNVAEALNTTAQTEKGLAKILESLATVGPWSLVIAATLAPVAQVLANHGVIPPNEQMGVLAPDQLVQAAAAAAGI